MNKTAGRILLWLGLTGAAFAGVPTAVPEIDAMLLLTALFAGAVMVTTGGDAVVENWTGSDAIPFATTTIL